MNPKEPAAAPSLPSDPSELDDFIDSAAALSGLKIDPAYRDGVKVHLAATANAAKFVLSFPLEDDAEPAPVFRP